MRIVADYKCVYAIRTKIQKPIQQKRLAANTAARRFVKVGRNVQYQNSNFSSFMLLIASSSGTNDVKCADFS